jgi:Ca2+-binding EF-hand superfamily protein
MANELGWSPERQGAEFVNGKQFLRTMGLASDIPFGAIFSKRRLIEAKNAFSKYDMSGSGYISKHDVPDVIRQLGIPTVRLTETMDKTGLSFVEDYEKVVDFGTLLSIIEELTPSKVYLLEEGSADGIHHKPQDAGSTWPMTERSGGGV